MNVKLATQTKQHQPQTSLTPTPRLYYLDNLKVALTCLVIAHHAGQPYGGSGGFWYYETGTEVGLQLGRFFSVNASFFMSLFFLISAYFLPASFDRKGAGPFLKDRFERLGVPILLGFFIIVPLMMYNYYIHFRDYENISFLTYYANIYFGFGGQPANWTGPSWPDMQFAHLWFLEHLLFYAIIYTLYRTLRKPDRITTSTKPLTNTSITLFAISVSILTSIVRIQFPIDYWTGFLGFIQAEFYHVPQYASFFVIGILAKQRNWLTTLPATIGKTWLFIGITLAVTYYLGLVTFPVRSGVTVGNITYSLYETIMCTGLIIGLIYLFRRRANQPSALMNTLAANAFAVYIIHVPVLVLVQFFLGKMAIPLSLQFTLAVLLGTMLSFLGSHFVIRKIPYLKKIL